MTDTTVIVISVAVGVILLGGLSIYHARRRETRDNARQDTIADRVAEVARITAEARTSTDKQLERIHTLVNSNLTAQMEDALASKKSQLVALFEVQSLKEAAGLESSAEARAIIKETQETIAYKQAELADRLQATARADMDAKE
jgi:hypothetical protein